MRYLTGFCVAAGVVFGGQFAQAVVVFQDNFDTYADQAAFEAVWAPIGCTGQGSVCTGNVSTLGGTLSQDFSGDPAHLNSVLIHSVPAPAPTTADLSQRNQTHFSVTPTLNIGDKIIFSYDFYDITPNTVYRQFVNLQTVAQPTLTNELVSMGLTNTINASADGGDRYMARILGYAPPATDPDGGTPNSLTTAGAYFKMNDTSVPIRTTGWHNLKAEISTDDGQSTDYKFYIDNALAETVDNVGTAATIRTYEFIRLGAGVSSTVDAYYDNFKVEHIAGAPAGVPGDYNGNGKVDAADYVLWRNGGPLQNEVDNPGTVDANDYAAWRARFGNVSGSGSGLQSAAVPEPLGALLFAFGAALVSGVIRQRS